MQAEPVAPHNDQTCQHIFKLGQYQSRKLEPAPQPSIPATASNPALPCMLSRSCWPTAPSQALDLHSKVARDALHIHIQGQQAP